MRIAFQEARQVMEKKVEESLLYPIDKPGLSYIVASFERKPTNERPMEIINLTPHVVRLNDGREFPPSGTVARVETRYTTFDADGIASVSFGAVHGLPEPEAGTLYVTSAMVASAAKRPDVVSPATGHKDCVRKDGQVWSVPGFVRA